MTRIINVLEEYLQEQPLYENTYGQWIKFFQVLSEAQEAITLQKIPMTWVPFALYLGHQVESYIYKFPSCTVVGNMLPMFASYEDKRAFVEAVSTFRPELSDTLWKYDMEWKGVPDWRRAQHVMPGHEILITNNGSFHRPEIVDYFPQLDSYTPTKKKVVLVPCAADKPYPSVLHQAVLERMPDDFYLACLTGALGIVPQDLWPIMPNYDAGIPNQWRLMNVAKNYFSKHPHSHIVVYSDFNCMPLHYGLKLAGIPDYVATWVNPLIEYDNYLDLTQPQYLEKLEAAFAAIKSGA